VASLRPPAFFRLEVFRELVFLRAAVFFRELDFRELVFRRALVFFRELVLLRAPVFLRGLLLRLEDLRPVRLRALVFRVVRFRLPGLLAVFLLFRLAGTFAPFSRASESPIAMACFRLVTVPPLPPLPLFKVPRLRRRIALSTALPAALPYFRFFLVAMMNHLCWRLFTSELCKVNAVDQFVYRDHPRRTSLTTENTKVAEYVLEKTDWTACARVRGVASARSLPRICRTAPRASIC